MSDKLIVLDLYISLFHKVLVLQYHSDKNVQHDRQGSLLSPWLVFLPPLNLLHCIHMAYMYL